MLHLVHQMLRLMLGTIAASCALASGCRHHFGQGGVPGHSTRAKQDDMERHRPIHPVSEDDSCSFMSYGVHVPATISNPSASMLPQVAHQAEIEEEAEFSDSESGSSTSESAWHATMIFTMSQPSRVLQLNAVNPNLRIQQIARAYQWPVHQVYANYAVPQPPQDLVDQGLQATLVQRHDELPDGSKLQLTLLDIEYHPVPPSWEVDRSRYPRYFPNRLTSRQFLENLELTRYCDHTDLPCLVWVNHVLWSLHDHTPKNVQHGSYFRVAIPPCGEQSCASTRYMAMGMHLGLSPHECETDYARLMSDDAIDAIFLLQRHRRVSGTTAIDPAHTTEAHRHKKRYRPHSSCRGLRGYGKVSPTTAFAQHLCRVEVGSAIGVAFSAEIIALNDLSSRGSDESGVSLQHEVAAVRKQTFPETIAMLPFQIPCCTHAGRKHPRCQTPRMETTLGYQNVSGGT